VKSSSAISLKFGGQRKLPQRRQVSLHFTSRISFHPVNSVSLQQLLNFDCQKGISLVRLSLICLVVVVCFLSWEGLSTSAWPGL
jgi:hypothetical protein